MDKPDELQLYSVLDFEKEAERRLPEEIKGYFNGGTDLTETLQDNVSAYSRYKLRPRHMRNVSNITTKQKVLGCDIEFPIIVGPFAYQKMLHPEGEVATARACTKMGTVCTIGISASASIEEIVQGSVLGVKWFQLYLIGNRKLIFDIVRTVERSGFKALIVTIDLKVQTNRLAEKKTNFEYFVPDLIRSHYTPRKSSDGVAQEDLPSWLHPTLSWKDIDWLKSITKLPIAVKGIMTREDAVEAVQHGVEGIIVSNHGGRALDTVEATIDALPEIVEAVKHTGVDILMDGGIRKGTDVIKALALGAKAVLVGRPVVWGLTVGGENGVRAVLEILKNEFRIAMGLSGCSSLADINQTIIKPSTASRL